MKPRNRIEWVLILCCGVMVLITLYTFIKIHQIESNTRSSRNHSHVAQGFNALYLLIKDYRQNPDSKILSNISNHLVQIATVALTQADEQKQKAYHTRHLGMKASLSAEDFLYFQNLLNALNQINALNLPLSEQAQQTVESGINALIGMINQPRSIPIDNQILSEIKEVKKMLMIFLFLESLTILILLVRIVYVFLDQPMVDSAK